MNAEYLDQFFADGRDFDWAGLGRPSAAATTCRDGRAARRFQEPVRANVCAQQLPGLVRLIEAEPVLSRFVDWASG